MGNFYYVFGCIKGVTPEKWDELERLLNKYFDGEHGNDDGVNKTGYEGEGFWTYYREKNEVILNSYRVRYPDVAHFFNELSLSEPGEPMTFKVKNGNSVR